jgi:hypothetical protein
VTAGLLKVLAKKDWDESQSSANLRDMGLPFR